MAVSPSRLAQHPVERKAPLVSAVLPDGELSLRRQFAAPEVKAVLAKRMRI